MENGALLRGRNSCVLIRGPPVPPLGRTRVSRICFLPFVHSCRPSCRGLNKISTVGRIGFSVVRGHNYFNGYGFYTLTCRRKHIIASHDRGSIVSRTRGVARVSSFGNCVRSINKPATGFEGPTYGKRLLENTYVSGGYLTPAVYGTIRISRDSCLSLLHRLQGLPGIGGIFVHSNVQFSCLITSGGSRFFGRLVGRRVDNRLGITPRRYSGGILGCVNGPPVRICGGFRGHFCRLAGSINGRRCLIPCLVSSRPKDAVGSTVRLTIFLGGGGLRPRRIRSFCPAPNAVSATVFCAKLSPGALGPICIPGATGRGARRHTLLRCFGPRGHRVILSTLGGTKQCSLVNAGGGYLVTPSGARGTIVRGGGGAVEGVRGDGGPGSWQLQFWFWLSFSVLGREHVELSLGYVFYAAASKYFVTVSW